MCGTKQALVAAAVGILTLVSASTAAADPRYEAMNAPEGVYWRSEPNWAAAERITGFGVYNGTIVEVHCYQSGTSVEGSADTMWEQATDVGGRGYGSGWLNEHFVNDGQPINQPSPGIPPCNASPPPPPPPPPASSGSAYTVINAEGGIYWRSAPDWNTPIAESGQGVYNGSEVVVHCYQSGTSVPDSADTMWEQATVVAGPGDGSGWLNEHFINDGSPIDQPSPGVPPCNAPAPTPIQPPPSTPSPKPQPSQQALAVDPNLWCYNSAIHRFDIQVREADWHVQYDGLQGTPHQNNWACRYIVVMTIPSLDGENGPLPPVTETFGVDFRAACSEQFPGSKLEYIPGPVGPPWPWQCLGLPGQYYPPPGIRLDSLLSNSGFTTGGLTATSAGRLSVQMSASGAAGRDAVAAARVLVAAGTRSVAHKGRYSIRVRLTPKGRRLLRGLHSLRVTFTFRFSPRAGRALEQSATLTLDA